MLRPTRDILAAEFSPFDMALGGVVVWRYDNGPWVREAEYAFRAGVASAGSPTTNTGQAGCDNESGLIAKG